MIGHCVLECARNSNVADVKHLRVLQKNVAASGTSDSMLYGALA